MTTHQPTGPIDRERALAGPTGEPVPGFSWQYLMNSTTVLGVIMALLTSLPLVHFFGVWPAVLWTIPAVTLLPVLVIYSVRAILGESRALIAARVTNGLLVAHWMLCAMALWMTGNAAAWVLAFTIAASWSIHLIFAGRGDLRTTLGLLGICTLPMLGFMLHAAWTEYPVWIATGVSASAVCMILSIGGSAKFQADTFRAMQKAVAETNATKSRLEFAIEAVGDGYFELDLEQMRYEPDQKLATKLGYDSATLGLDAILGRIHPEDAHLLRAEITSVMERRSTGYNLDLRVMASNGEPRWMHVRARVLELEGESRRLIGTLVDLSERKRLEEELRAAKETAEASSRAKSQFLANMSHEIRTPLNGVLGMAQALEADNLATEQKEKVSIILDSGKALTALLNDVLDLTKIEAGKLEISATPGDFLHTMKRTRQLFQSQAEDKGLDLFVRYDSNFPQRLTYDPVRVRQCVSNLLSNAIKFTSKGSVEVAISSRALGEGAHLVAVEVSDTGIGISQETIGRLFTLFTQADGATTRKFGGSGLGLAISRQLARMMGGDITVESAEGRGSTFRLTFRAQEAAALPEGVSRTQGSAVLDKRTLRGMRVLLTDDNAINRQVIKLFLAPQGCDIVEATNGKEALDHVASGEFDVVLLDVHMPVMDGKETIQRIRANAKWTSLPVIALTADAMSGDRERYLALGMTDYVSKPVDQRELISKMYQVLKLETPSAPGEAKTGT